MVTRGSDPRCNPGGHMSRSRSASPLSRRAFLSTGAAAAGALALGCADGSLLAPFTQAARRFGGAPDTSGIEHIVLTMMENRSFDHLLGWLPRADGRQAGVSYTDGAGASFSTFPLAPDFQGCGHQDPDHSYAGARIEYNDGACDGWLRINDVFSIGYYRRGDLAFLGNAAPQWASFDRYFAAILGPTFPNRVYQHAGQTDRIENSFTVSTLPTIWDRLAAAGLDGRYYFGAVPILGLWGEKYGGISRPLEAFFADCLAGTLPPVAFVDGPFLSEFAGTGFDDHPFNDVRAGEAFMNQVYRAVTTSPAWSRTVLIINFDEWGGFFDHVPPPLAPLPDADRLAGNQDGRLGFRTPALIISPWSRRGYVSNIQFDHTSVLKLIQWRWRLAPLTVRDAAANNLALALDFEHPNSFAPLYSVPMGPFGGVCGQSLPSTEESVWATLTSVANKLGFPLP